MGTTRGKKHEKCYSIAKYGLENAFRLAVSQRESHAKSLEYEPGGLKRKKVNERPGIRRDQSSWIADWKKDGKMSAKRFGISKYGEEEAMRLAIEFRENLLETGTATFRPNLRIRYAIKPASAA